MGADGWTDAGHQEAEIRRAETGFPTKPLGIRTSGDDNSLRPRQTHDRCGSRTEIPVKCRLHGRRAEVFFPAGFNAPVRP
jgi:hypothetical protein